MKNIMIIYVWKKPPTENNRFSWPRLKSLFSKPSTPPQNTEPSIKESHIAVSIANNDAMEYYSFWPDSIAPSDQCGGQMHTQDQDIQSMGRVADHILVLNDIKIKATENARYLAALWVNHLHFNKLPWQRQLGSHKTHPQNNTTINDFSAIYIYNVLLSGAADRYKGYLLNMTLNATPDSLYGRLNTLPDAIRDLDLFKDNFAQKPIVLPEFPLYLKYNNKIKDETDQSFIYEAIVDKKLILQTEETKLIKCIHSDGKKSLINPSFLETDYEKYKQKEKNVSLGNTTGNRSTKN